MKKGFIVLISLLMLCLLGCAVGNESIDVNDIKMVITQDGGYRTKITDTSQEIKGYPSCIIYTENSIDKYASFINGLNLGIQYVGEKPEYKTKVTIWFVHENNDIEEYVFGLDEDNYYVEYKKPNGETKTTISQSDFDELFKIMSSETSYTYLIDHQDVKDIVTEYKELCLTCEGIPSLAN